MKEPDIMKARNNNQGRRTFFKSAATITAAGAICGGFGAGRAPDTKDFTTGSALPGCVLGKTGIKLPILGFGGAALPQKWGNARSTKEREKLVRHAYDKGIRYFDTSISYTYADSQAIIGSALKDVREKVFITTKVDFWNTKSDDGRFTKVPKGEAMRQIKMNLRELQSDYIDAILLHGTPGVEQLTVEQAMEIQGELLQARKEGLVRFVGFSAHHYFEKALELISTGQFDLCMLAYGYLPRGHSRFFSPRTVEFRNACLAKAHELKMGIVAMKVMGAGMLGGFGRKHLEKLPGAACRYVLQDDRVHILAIGMRYAKEIDANVQAVAGDTTYTNEDRGLLAGVSCAVLGDERVKKMPVE